MFNNPIASASTTSTINKLSSSKSKNEMKIHQSYTKPCHSIKSIYKVSKSYKPYDIHPQIRRYHQKAKDLNNGVKKGIVLDNL